MSADREKRSPGRPKEPIKRETLLDIARGAFAQSGFAGASMNNIATEAGLRKSSLFHHFDSKSKLYGEVVLNIVAELDNIILDAGTLQGSYRERLDRLNSTVVDYLGSHPWSALLVLREALDEQLFMEEEGMATVERALGRLAGFLAAGMKDNVFAKSDPSQLAVSIVAIHFLHFAASGVVTRFLGEEVFDPASLSKRNEILCAQVRRLCGLPD